MTPSKKLFIYDLMPETSTSHTIYFNLRKAIKSLKEELKKKNQLELYQMLLWTRGIILDGIAQNTLSRRKGEFDD